MELKHDCVREVLLFIEKNKPVDNYLESSELSSSINEFSSQDINYSIKQLTNAGFIESKAIMVPDLYLIGDLTWYGHQFLDDIRDDKIWKETKSRASQVSSASLPILQQIAVTVSKKMLGLD